LEPTNKFNGEPALSFVPEALAQQKVAVYNCTWWFIIDKSYQQHFCFTVATSIA
jgi:hypothetical protein